jgi:hypothetical protein
MNKYIKILALTAVTSATTFLLFQKVLANKNEIKVTPQIEVTQKHNDVAENRIPFPRPILTEEWLPDTQVAYGAAQYEHCNSCKMGAFLKNQNGEEACTYCSKTK